MQSGCTEHVSDVHQYFAGALMLESTGGTGQIAMTPGSLMIKLQMPMIQTSHPEVDSTPAALHTYAYI